TVLTDYRSGFVYNESLYPLIGFSLGLALIEGEMVLRLLRATFWLMLVMGVAFGLQKVLKKQTMGEGDYFVIFAFSLVARFQEMMQVIFLSSLIGLVVAWRFKKVSLPFVPLLGVAFCLVFVFRFFK
uniref:prepilin peptidase n=1 Tax=Candidatus Magnetaquicoccus inordinatus TaxID=2496818 RepID=UPI00187D39AD